MAIVNLTPDSFYDGGKYGDPATVISEVARMLDDGAYIIDLGAVSTRPGAQAADLSEERKRLMPVLRDLRREFPQTILSVDTFRAEIAREAMDHGADIINDISGGNMDGEMIPLIIRLGVPYVLMHMQGTPQTMQLNPAYHDVVAEVKDFLESRARHISEHGNSDLILDPGFGFGKTVMQNFRLLDRLEDFCRLGFPVMAGFSRKSMINKVLGTGPVEALNGPPP